MPRVLNNEIRLSADQKTLEYCSRTASGTFAIPYGIKTIGKQSFLKCDKITGIIIPDSVETIAPFAFNSCASLEYVIISDRVETIGDFAFENCPKLHDVKIPVGVKNIGRNIFYGSPNMTVIEVDPHNNFYFSYDGMLFTKGGALQECPPGKSGVCSIPNSTSEIGVDDFSPFLKCERITSIVIPDGVTELPTRSFSGCSSLTSVTLPYGLKHIGKLSFWFCDSLTELTIPNTVERLNCIDAKLTRCKMLTEIRVSDALGVYATIDLQAHLNSGKRYLEFPERTTACGELAIIKQFLYGKPVSASELDKLLKKYSVRKSKQGILSKKPIHLEIALAETEAYRKTLQKILLTL